MIEKIKQWYLKNINWFVIGPIYAAIVGIILNSVTEGEGYMTWFMTLWTVLAIEIIICIIQGVSRKKITAFKLGPVVASVLSAIIYSIVYAIC